MIAAPLAVKESDSFRRPGIWNRIDSLSGGRPFDNESTIYADGTGAIGQKS